MYICKCHWEIIPAPVDKLGRLNSKYSCYNIVSIMPSARHLHQRLTTAADKDETTLQHDNKYRHKYNRITDYYVLFTLTVCPLYRSVIAKYPNNSVRKCMDLYWTNDCSLSTSAHSHPRPSTAVNDELVSQSTQAGVIVNGKKTKEMLIGNVIKNSPVLLSLNGTTVDRVPTFKLLGVQISNDLKWTQHIDAAVLFETIETRRIAFQ